ncbi:MAG: FG-GAP-like repeat-containing protein [Candidatus Staskawiczbacteria bacterium]|nr:FG-GAP-like repeat-containing protein [Candidatus Staskawiczbacteria bacterium]
MAYKITATFLIFAFLITPIAPAFAETSDDVFVSDTSDTPVLPVPALDTTTPMADGVPADALQSNIQAVTPSDQTAESKALDQSNPAQPPASVSSMTQKLPEIDKNTGALNYSYPISIPPGRNNLQPDIALSYNSSQNEQAGIFGYGWELNIPYIQRLNKTGTDSLYSSNYFYSSLDGELSTVDSSSFVARTENGSFNKYTFSNNQWLVVAKDGTQYKFGYNSASQQNDPQNPGNVYKWMLQEVRDANNNYISYSYFKDAGQIYPLAIRYTGNGNTGGIFEVSFATEARADNTASYGAGFLATTNYRISQITASASGNWVNKYDLAYETGSNGSRSILQSITESGKTAGGNIIAKPKTSFNYANDLYAGKTTYDLPSDIKQFSDYAEFADLNGDGLTDVLISYSSSGFVLQKAYLNNGKNGWTESPSYQPPAIFVSASPSFLQTTHFFTDINGDGLPDLIIPCQGPAIFINTGSGWNQDFSWQFKIPGIGSICTNGSFPNANFFDINGDGLPDFFAGTSVDSAYYSNTGSSFVKKSYSPPEYTYNSTGSNKIYFPNADGNSVAGIISTDVNGDGILDIIASYHEIGQYQYQEVNNYPYDETVQKTWLGDGLGNFYLSDNYAPPTLFSFRDYIQGAGYGGNHELGVRVIDYNGDGLVDLVQATSNTQVVDSIPYQPLPGQTVTAQRVFLNTGKGWAEPFDVSLPYNFSVGGSAYAGKLFALGNFSGDNPNEIYFQQTSNLVLSPAGNDLLNSITLNTGETINISYAPSTLYNNSLGNLPNPKLPLSVQTVSKINATDPVNNIVSSENYQYFGGTYYYKGPFDRNLAGFAEIDQIDSAQNVTKTFYNTGSGNDSSRGQYQDNYFKIGKAYRTEQYDNSGKLYQVNINKWDSYNLAGSAGFAKLIQATKEDYDGTINHKDKTESYSYDNSNGNQTQKIEWGQVLANNDGSFTDVGNDKYITNISYAAGGNVVGYPSGIIVSGQNNNKIKESRYYYDNLPLGSVSLGNQTKEEDWINNSNYASSQKVYNNYGLVSQSKDANGNATNFSYDSYNLYPAIITNALSQTTQYIYNYANGKIAQTTDANGNVFKNTYDGFGRILKTEQPDQANPATLVQKTFYIYTDTSGALSVQQTDYLDSSTAVNSYNYYDGLGRIIQTKKSAENNNFETKDYIYNNLGQLQKESLPYFSNSFGRTLPTQDFTLYTSYAYDALNRAVSSINSVGATITAYNNWKTSVTDANGKTKDFYEDAYGNLIQVGEHNASNIYSTYYSYNGLSDLINITDALGNVRNFSYDGLDRKLIAEDLHNPTDSVFGVWNYTYDNVGNLISLTDAKNQTINYNFDALNRKTSEDYAGKAGVEATFIYDACPNGKGLLCKSVSAQQTEQYEYSSLGNITKDTKIIDTKTFITQYNFDRQGNQILIINPDNSQIKNIYNPAGLLDQIQKKESTDTAFANVISNFDYSPLEQITTESFANGAISTNTYDSAKLYRLANKITNTATGTQLQNLAYIYDNVGNIIQFVDNSATDSKKTVAYTYDDLYRLLSSTATNVASGQQAYTQSFTYDALGNMLSQKLNDTTTTYDYKGNLNNAGSSYANPDAVTKTSATKTNSQTVVVGKSAEPIAKIILASNRVPVGYIDGVMSTTYAGWIAYGWTADPDVPNTSISVDIYIDGAIGTGTFLSRVSANTASPDVTKVFPAYTGNHRFIYSIPAKYQDGKPHTIYIYGIDSAGGANFLLSNSPKTFTIGDPGTNNFQYDQNGNITSDGINSYTYDYNNRLVSATNISANTTTTYAYDANGQRIKITTNPSPGLGSSLASSTYYPTQNYNASYLTPTTQNPTSIVKHIFANNQNIATINGTGAVAKIYYNATDSLNSSSVMTDSAGALAETMDYFPFGAIRIDNKTSSFTEQRKYIGQEFDADTGLNYLNARYYNSALARFISEDSASRDNPEKFLADPQQLNYYSYSRNNPITLSDPTGQSWKTFVQGSARGVVYAGAVTVLVAGAITALPIEIPAAIATGIGVGVVSMAGAATVYGSYKNYQDCVSGKISKDQFDYNSGEMLGGWIGAGTTAKLLGGLGKTLSAENSLEIDTSVKQFGKSIYQGKVNLQPTVDAIESGKIGPKINKNTGLTEFYRNAEGHSQLNYNNGNQYLEYPVNNSGAPSNTAERMLVGTKNGDMYYTSDHYQSITTIKR